MTLPTNLGFETIGARAGQAAGWTTTVVSSAREIGGYFGGQNLLAQSEIFDDLAWSAFNVTPDDQLIASWDGLLIGSGIVDLGSSPAFHDLSQPIGATSGAYTFEVEAKAGALGWLALTTSNGARGVFFNIGAGTLGTISGAGVTASITSLGNGWYRCRMTDPTITADTFAISTSNGDGSVVYTGTGVVAFYITRARVVTAAAFALGIPYTTTTETPVDLYLPWESFETLWTNDGYLFGFPAGKLVAGLYESTGPYLSEPVEDFEEAWNQNETYVLDVNSVSQTGLYDSGAHGFDGFGSWFVGSYVNAFVGAPTDLTSGLYDSGGGNAFEAFNSWFSGSYVAAFIGAPTDLTTGIFAGTWGNDFAETFERILTPISFAATSINTTTDVINIPSHGLSLNEPVDFSTSGTLPTSTPQVDLVTTYYVAFVDPNNIKLSIVPSGATIDFTAQGSGTHTLNGDALSFWPYPAISSW